MAKVITLFEEYNELVTKNRNILLENRHMPGVYEYGVDAWTYRNIIKSIGDSSQDLHIAMLYTFTGVMDVYSLRRILDKDYITNAILYTGGYHSGIYIRILLKNFGFRISHIARSTVSIAEFESEVKARPDNVTFSDMLMPPTPSQCADLTDFPRDFN